MNILVIFDYFFTGSSFGIVDKNGSMYVFLCMFSQKFNIYEVDILDKGISHHALCDLYCDFRKIYSSYVENNPSQSTLAVLLLRQMNPCFKKPQKYHKKIRRYWAFGMAQRDEGKSVRKIVPYRKKRHFAHIGETLSLKQATTGNNLA